MAKTIEQVVGENVKRLREQRGMSQMELGEEVGMLLGTKWVPQTVSAAERGKRQFIAAEMVALANILGCKVQHLFESRHNESIRVSDAFTLPADYAASWLEASGVTDEHLRDAYRKLRVTLEGLPDLTESLKAITRAIESTVIVANSHLDLDAIRETDA